MRRVGFRVRRQEADFGCDKSRISGREKKRFWVGRQESDFGSDDKNRLLGVTTRAGFRVPGKRWISGAGQRRRFATDTIQRARRVLSLRDGHDFDEDDEDVKHEDDEKGETKRADQTDTTKRRR